MNIKDITKKDRPRERIIENGAKSLSDTELLAIILSVGNKNEGVMELSSRLINTYGLNQLLYMSYDEISKISGIKEAKATKLLACFEMAKRSVKVYDNIILFNTSNDIYDYIKNDYIFESREVLTILYVTSKLKLIKKIKYSNNSTYSCEFPIKKIVQESLGLDAYGIIMIHNHPSGDKNPSHSDIDVTQTLKIILRELDILLLDHIIITQNYYYSFDENNLLNLSFRS
jgi:DNA repair protein RadC